MKKWTRYRFHANPDDPRPVTFPPPGPWWCSGFGDDYSIVIAWFPSDAVLADFWPEATEIEAEKDAGPPTYTSRFPKPEWYNG